MFTTNVKKYDLDASDEQAICLVRNIIDELDSEGFFEEDPFYNYCADDFICLLTDLLENDGSAIG
jgi:hypothetical protein